ncbi:MAG: hypothetical protein KDJ29_10840 [Hyphomicrobiales bacterium]|nr:hypothetical protein [Hyphomicrobiales bacterium]
MALDWKQASVEERKTLYRATRALVDDHLLTWDDIYAGAFGNSFLRGQGYEDNFGSGRIARWRAALIYRWLRREHPAQADLVDRDIAALYDAPAQDWENFVNLHGRFEGVTAIRQERQLMVREDHSQRQVQSQPQIQRYNPADDHVDDQMDLNHPFSFEIDTPFAGSIVGVQWVRGQWHALPLGASEVDAAVPAGINALPQAHRLSLYNGLLIELSEAGIHRIVFLLVPQDLAMQFRASLPLDSYLNPERLSEMAGRIAALPPGTWKAYRLNLMFIASDYSGGVLR